MIGQFPWWTMPVMLTILLYVIAGFWPIDNTYVGDFQRMGLVCLATFLALVLWIFTAFAR